MPRVELIWPTPKMVMAKIDGRELHIVGVEQIEGDVHYVVSSRFIKKWADGEPLDPDERDTILRDVVAAGRARGWNLEIS
jgi:hypothetical protein